MVRKGLRSTEGKPSSAPYTGEDYEWPARLATRGSKDLVTTYTADGAIDEKDSFVELDATDASTEMTIAAPTPGRRLVISCANASNTVTVTLTAGTFDGTNEIATFDAAEETLILYGISSTRFVVVHNEGSVALSSAA